MILYLYSYICARKLGYRRLASHRMAWAVLVHGAALPSGAAPRGWM